MKQLNFLPANIFLLTEDGLIKSDGSRSERPVVAGTVLVQRGMCRFEYFPAPAGLGNGAAERAALLAAEARAPFARPGYVVIRGILGYGLWWWDEARLLESLPPRSRRDRVQILPESIIYGVDEGVRILRLSEGFEAQRWNDATLVASTWRRGEFDARTWAVFLASSPDEEAHGSRALPAPQLPKAQVRKLEKFVVTPRVPVWAQLQRAAYLVCALLLVPTVFFAGEAARYEHIRRADTSATAGLAALSGGAGGPGKGSLVSDLELLNELAARADENPTISALSAASAVLDRFGLDFERATIENGNVQIELTGLSGSQLEPLAAALEADSLFGSVRPQLDSATGRAVITAVTCRKRTDEACG
jgi:hypothetical protein